MTGPSWLADQQSAISSGIDHIVDETSAINGNIAASLNWGVENSLGKPDNRSITMLGAEYSTSW